MKRIKDLIFMFLIIFVLVIGYIFIKQTIILKQNYLREYIYDVDESLNEYFNNYKIDINNINIGDDCKLEINNLIDILISVNIKTNNKEELIELYKNSDNRLFMLNYSNITNKCNISNEDISKYALRHYILINEDLFNYDNNINIKLPGNSYLEDLEQDLTSVKQNVGLDTISLIRESEKAYLESIKEVIYGK